ncbi:hypothetical protein [uncultured Chitinophaga sp.]|nr:hypothetical protein [uncultured Chitinophaga sp.]
MARNEAIFVRSLRLSKSTAHEQRWRSNALTNRRGEQQSHPPH